MRQLDELRGRLASDAEAVTTRVIHRAALAVASVLVLAALLALLVVHLAARLRARTSPEP
jgi:hypothetical protein